MNASMPFGRLTLAAIVVVSVSTITPAQETAEPSSPSPSSPPADTVPAAAAEAPAEPAPPARADLSQVRELLKARDYAAAEELLSDAVEQFPDDPTAHLTYGEVLLALGDPEEAREMLARAAELAPERERVHFQLGSAEASLGNSDAAIEAFGKELGLSEDPQIVSLARMNRALLYQKKESWSAAADELQGFLDVKPDALQAWGDLSTVLLKANRVDEARDALGRGREAGFASARHLYSVGAHLYDAERYEDSVAVLKETLELDAEFADAERTLGACLDALGRTDEATAHLKRYLELKPDAKDKARILERING